MQRSVLLSLAGLMACGAALAATPGRPPITSVSHLAVYAGDAPRRHGWNGRYGWNGRHDVIGFRPQNMRPAARSNEPCSGPFCFSLP